MLRMTALERIVVAGLLACLLPLAAAAAEKEMASAWNAVGVHTGSIHDKALRAHIGTDVPVKYYKDVPAMIEALKKGDVDAVVMDYPVLAVSAASDSTVRLLPQFETDEYAVALRKDDKELADKVDAAVAELQRERMLDFLSAKWVDGLGGERALPELEHFGDEGVFRYGVAEIGAPFVYRDAGGALVGLDVELAMFIAQILKMRLELVPMEFDQLMTALLDKKVDAVASAITVTPGRKERVHFTRSYYTGGPAVMVRIER